MKKILITLLLVISGVTANAQEGLKWYTDINKAIEASRQEQKPLFLFNMSSQNSSYTISKFNNRV